MTPAEVARTIAYNIRAELVCCDAYDRFRCEPDDAENHGHGLCYWGEAAARVALTTTLAGDIDDPCECAAVCPTCRHRCLGGHSFSPKLHWCPDLHYWDDNGGAGCLVIHRTAGEWDRWNSSISRTLDT